MTFWRIELLIEDEDNKNSHQHRFDEKRGKSAEDIAQMFNDAGYEAIVEQSTKGSQLSKQVRIKGHNINNIQVHPGGGTHGGAYYKISTSNQGVIKVAEKATYHNNRGTENATFHWIDE